MVRGISPCPASLAYCEHALLCRWWGQTTPFRYMASSDPADPLAVTRTPQVRASEVKANESRHGGPEQPWLDRDSEKTPPLNRAPGTATETPAGKGGGVNKLAGAHPRAPARHSARPP